MRDLRRLKALHAFEAVARHGSYIAAAEELSVTPAAVGQHIRALEAAMAVALFVRSGRGAQRLSPTREALLIIADVRQAFDLLDASLQRIKEVAGRQSVAVTVSQSFAAKWLMPRIVRFSEAFPHIDVRVDISDRLVSLGHGEAELGIRCGQGEWPQCHSMRLMGEEVFPVCSPAFAKKLRKGTTPNELPAKSLIVDASPKPSPHYPTWTSWLQFSGVQKPAVPRGLHLNSASAVMQAAANGQGVALARGALVRDDLIAGQLVRLFPRVRITTDWAYYLVAPIRNEPSAASRAFSQWLIDECKR
jgi:LysR family transcriptional regulator, glycine cleavage system transcriptional activator